MFCSECGKIINESAKFCKYCGAPQVSTQSTGEENTSYECEEQISREHSLGKFMSFFVGALAVVIIVLFYCISNVQECDWCGASYIGDAYFDVMSDDVMCEDCAKQYYMGLNYQEYRID